MLRATLPSDLETRATDDHHDALRVWLRLLATSNLIEARVRTRLQERFGMTLPRFDLLSQLERVPAGLSMSELSARMMVTGGNVTGITDALEREGLVVREADPDDRRVWLVRLTSAGRRSFRAMAEEHEQWIVGMFAGLPSRDIAHMNELLGRLKTHLRTSTKDDA